MIDRLRALAASREEVRQLASLALSEVTPSRRDFAQFVATQREDLAVIARLVHTPALLEQARACDDAEVAALAVATLGGDLAVSDMAAVADATTAPILREDPALDRCQLYYARLHGADAVLLPAAELDAATLQELVTVASSLHMASVIDVQSAAEVDVALRMPHAILGLRCTAAGGGVDVIWTQGLTRGVPRQRTVICLSEVRTPAECAALRGVCDAVVVGETLQGATDVNAALRALVGN